MTSRLGRGLLATFGNVGFGSSCFLVLTLLTLCTLVPAAAQTPPDAEVRVDVRGLSNAMRDNVLATMALARTPSRTRLSEGRVQALLNRSSDEVRAALEPFGYYEPTSRASVRYDGRRWRVTVDVDPGPAVLLTAAEVRIEGPGAQDTAFARVRARAALTPGQPASHVAYEALKGGLISTALDRGYLDASLDSAVLYIDRDRHEARAVLALATGPRYALGPVTFIQESLDPRLLDKLVPWEPGDPFRGAELLELQLALTGGPYFATAEIIPARDRVEGLVVPIDVVLMPNRPQLYSIGGGYGTDTGVRATFSAEFRRLNRSGHRATIDAWVAQVERRATTSYLIPLRRSPMASLLSLNAGWVDANPTTSATETWLVGASLEGVTGDWRTQVSTSLERSSFEVGTQSGISTLLLIGGGVTRVRADDRIEPRDGSLARLRLQGGHDVVLADVRLFDLGLEGRWIQGLGDRFRLLWRGEVGALITSDFNSLPGSLRYFAGGDRSIRGYRYQELGPIDEFGDVIGATRLLVTSLEVDATVRSGWRVALFADLGNAVDGWRDPLEAGAGAGIRWRSPIGMVRFDGAFAVTRSGWPFRFHVNIGPEL